MENKRKELTLDATIDNVQVVSAVAEEQMDLCDVPLKAQMQIQIAIDELFSNIARYAYTPETGSVTVYMELLKEPRAFEVTFLDRGVPYNPLEKEEPDVTLSAEEREIGGLGIYMVRKNMDEVIYEYTDGQNILRIRKNF